jgi:hypothetical protein
MADPDLGQNADLAEAIFNLANNGVLSRIDERGTRCHDLFQWGIHPHHPDEQSPLAADDATFAKTYPLTLAGPHAVTEHALFPAMSASENIDTAGLLVERRRTHRRPHLSEIMQLCRSAMESSALTIWLLSDPNREVRRDRCMSEEMEQLEQRSRFLTIAEWDETHRAAPYPQHLLDMNADHRRRYAEMMVRIKKAYNYSKPPSFTKMVTSAAQWVDSHLPAHDAGEIAANGLEGAARSFYSYGSSFIHGYKWMTEYARGGTVFTLLADSLAVSLNMTECAVCLYEAAARAPGASRPTESYLPERLEPTVAAWYRELFAA